MKKYKVSIKGLHPLIWNRMKKELEDEKKQLKRNELGEWEENRENWVRKAELSNGNALVPNEWVKSMLISACKTTRIVPHYASRKNETYTRYMESVMIDETSPICKSKDLQAYGAFVGAQGKGSSTKVWRVRPFIEKWKLDFSVIDPYGRMKLSELKELLDYSGMFIGLGDNRVNNFGRFDVTAIKEIK